MDNWLNMFFAAVFILFVAGTSDCRNINQYPKRYLNFAKILDHYEDSDSNLFGYILLSIFLVSQTRGGKIYLFKFYYGLSNTLVSSDSSANNFI